MTLTLHTLSPSRGSRKKRRRIGRGNASGRGIYSGRGQKGQKARSGGRKGLKLLGMKKLLQSTPKTRGFRSSIPRPEIMNVGQLEKRWNPEAVITPASLHAQGLIRSRKDGVKILGDGRLTKKLTIQGCAISKNARKKIVQAGGTINK